MNFFPCMHLYVRVISYLSQNLTLLHEVVQHPKGISAVIQEESVSAGSKSQKHNYFNLGEQNSRLSFNWLCSRRGLFHRVRCFGAVIVG